MKNYVAVSYGQAFRIASTVDNAPVKKIVFKYGKLDTRDLSEITPRQVSTFSRTPHFSICKAVCFSRLTLDDLRFRFLITLQWRHNERDGVSNHGHLDCLLSRSFKRTSKKISQLRVTSLCEVTGGFLSQTSNNAENVLISWRYHVENIRR